MKRTLTPLTAALTAGALVLAACGGGDSTDTTTVAPTAAPSTAAPTTAPVASDIVAVASANPDFSTLVAAVQAAGLVETLQGPGPFTVFAPTNDAFDALPAGLVDALLLPENNAALAEILTYHVVAGTVLAADVTAGVVATVQGENLTISTDGGVKVNDANVVATDVIASNGVIHVIDAVIVPPSLDVEALLAGSAGDIVDVATAAGSFTTLLAAIDAAGLAETLQGDGPFTVFAPTDDAFAALDPALVAKLLLPENKDVLAAILTYHVVAGAVTSDLVTAGEVTSVQGDAIVVSIEGYGSVRLNGAATVTTVDIAASNGVIHVIDAVILPPSLDIVGALAG
jgi:transforming growth factor-beta-induced protein